MTATAELRRAQSEITRLEQAWLSAKAPDARRMLDNERNGLMAACQIRTGAALDERTTEAARVRAMWEGH